jgi:hypothetical protein
MGGADHDGGGGDATALLDVLAGFQHQVARNHQGIDTHQRDTRTAVVEDRGANFAWIVECPVEGFAVPSRLPHTDLGRNVAFGETGFKLRATRRLRQGRRSQRPRLQEHSSVHSLSIITQNQAAAASRSGTRWGWPGVLQG